MKIIQPGSLILMTLLALNSSYGDVKLENSNDSKQEKLEIFAVLGFQNIKIFESSALTYFTSCEQTEPVEAIRTIFSEFKEKDEENIPGLNPHRPLGIIFYGDHRSPKSLPFFPVDNEGEFLNLCEFFFPGREQIEHQLFKLTGEFSTYLKIQNNYAFVSTDKSVLEHFLPDPMILFPRSAQKFDFAVHANLSQIPQRIRGVVKSEIQENSLKSAIRFPDESLASFNKRLSESQFNASFLNGLVEGGKRITLGGMIDSESAAIELTLLAESSNPVFRNILSEFLGQAPSFASLQKENSVLSLRGSFKRENYISKTYLKWIDDLKSAARSESQSLLDESRELYEKVNIFWKGIQSLQAMIEGDLKDSRFDFSFDVGQVNENHFELAFVTKFKKTEELSTWLKEQLPTYIELGFIKDSIRERVHKGIKIFTMTPKFEVSDNSKYIFGPSPNLSLGVGTKNVYLTIGQSALPLMIRSIDNAENSAAEQEVEFSVKCSKALPVLKRFGIDQGLLYDIGSHIDSSKDEANLEVRSITGGVRMKIQLESGFNRILSKLYLNSLFGF